MSPLWVQQAFPTGRPVDINKLSLDLKYVWNLHAAKGQSLASRKETWHLCSRAGPTEKAGEALGKTFYGADANVTQVS